MHTNWITTAAALPSDGTLVEFMLDQRECPMRGIYALGRFESRWTQYAPTSVRQWRDTALSMLHGADAFGLLCGPRRWHSGAAPSGA